MFRDRDVECKQQKSDEIREMRRQQAQRKNDKQEELEKNLEARTRELKHRLQLENTRRNEIERKAIASRREQVERQRELNSYIPTTVDGIALSKAQVRVRDDRLNSARELNDSKTRYRLEREIDQQHDREWKLFLSSSVRKKNGTSPSSSPLSTTLTDIHSQR
eukprot:TRINITY_DN34741_c0_g1_i1.p1 TRINITY_DN34741_c0_g1~~TRINITY_DN34741_c0_g1_i1.p1  ORF type:complete len:172 (+),score=37.65 TRINITY_DN34741_c0_g1_i1:30-518(+)